MAASDLVDLSGLMDDAKCFAFVRQRRWPEGVRCPGCGSDAVIRDGRDDAQPDRQRYRCKACAGRFDDLTGTALAGRHQPLRVWVLCLYFMGLNLSNRQIALELGLSPSEVQAMTEQLRQGLVATAPEVALAGGLSRDWGSCRDGCWRMRIVGGLEALPEAGAERAVVDGAADLEQPVGPAPGPAHLLRLGHAPVDGSVQRLGG
jgi:transposase-like protein